MAIDSTAITAMETTLKATPDLQSYVIDGQNVTKASLKDQRDTIDWAENRVARTNGKKPRASSFRSPEY